MSSLTEGHTLPATESLFDLLYVDARRIATYMAQLDPNGTLTGIKTTASGTTTLNAEGKVGVVVASGSIGGTDASTEASETQFDPLWALPITLMNRLDELGFIHRGLNGSAIGSLVLIKGWCRLIDIAAVKEMWPIIGKLLAQQDKTAQPPPLPDSRRDRQNKRQGRTVNYAGKDPAQGVFGMIAEIAQYLPHGLELHMLTENGTAWATLNRDGLITNSQDIALKHGSALPGEWHLLGVIDAVAGETADPNWDKLPIHDFTQAIVKLLDGIRGTMGRPASYYGITPILLFRTITRPAVD